MHFLINRLRFSEKQQSYMKDSRDQKQRYYLKAVIFPFVEGSWNIVVKKLSLPFSVSASLNKVPSLSVLQFILICKTKDNGVCAVKLW